MCEFCTGNVKLEHSSANSPGSDSQAGSAKKTADDARSALSLDADLAKPPNETDAKQSLLKKYGVETREVNDGQTEFFYRAGGHDNVVLRTASDADSLAKAPDQLDKIVQQRVDSIEKQFKVTIAKPGEFATTAEVNDDDCKPVAGDKVYARQGTLPVLFGLEEGLRQSQPSQFLAGGKEGIKIYLLDKQAAPDFYGGRKVQGTYRFKSDNGKPVIYITPAGQEQPATSKDTLKPGDRNVAWITTHEIAHNSQSLQWGRETPENVAVALGWEKYQHKSGVTVFPFIEGKNGDLYFNGSDSCKTPTTWFSIHKTGWPLDANGLPVKSVAEASKFTNEEVMDRAKVRPSTFYFSSPFEEMAEAITSYRYSPESRAQLFKQSPKLYEITAEYDRKELADFYGKDWSWNAKMVRTPDGRVVPRTSDSVRQIDEFEKQLRAGG
ncbi:hypothetical protein KF728_23355 [Candidatus Obscuribacterales bacterium]|nr:hypothetical protein [Candidatus Obscuribacterales bacterium]